MRYYSTQRTIGPGTCPRKDGMEVTNFEEKTYCKDIGMSAWGYIDYPEPLSNREAKAYELVREDIFKPFEENLTGKMIQTPRGTFHETRVSKDEAEAAGFGPHHNSDDGKYIILSNGTEAYAVDAEYYYLQANDYFAKKSNLISVLLIQPGEYPKMIKIEDSLEAMQKVVGGYIEEFYFDYEDDDVVGICNEEGKILSFPPNRGIYDSYNNLVDVVAGNFIIAYAPADSESFLSLPDNLAEKYKEKFYLPERFYKVADGIKVVPFTPTTPNRNNRDER